MDVIGPLQLRVMNHIWEHGPCTVHQVHDALNAAKGVQKLAYTTILTVMRNLARRAILDQRPAGRSHIFEPLINADDYRRTVLAQVGDDLFDGDLDNLVKYINKNKPAIAKAGRGAVA